MENFQDFISLLHKDLRQEGEQSVFVVLRPGVDSTLFSTREGVRIAVGGAADARPPRAVEPRPLKPGSIEPAFHYAGLHGFVVGTPAPMICTSFTYWTLLSTCPDTVKVSESVFALIAVMLVLSGAV